MTHYMKYSLVGTRRVISSIITRINFFVDIAKYRKNVIETESRQDYRSQRLKRKARRKLKRIFRKSTPKSSSLYKLAIDYKLWYATYVHRCDCFFLPTLQILKDGQQTSCYKIVNKQVCIV